MRRGSATFALLGMAVLATSLHAEVRRVVIFKLDGVNADLLHQWMTRTEARSGRSCLPWINEIFGNQGTRIENFFVRGISLSAPSWSLLDTARHQIIHGNVEYDRWTLEPYDYLNFFPFYVNSGEGKRVDMPAVETLDENGIPLLIDSFSPSERWQSLQLYQRGNEWTVIRQGVPHHFSGRSPKEWFDEWQSGLDLSSSFQDEEERELIDAMRDSRIKYLDFYSGDWDHVAHLTNDSASQLRVMQSLDAAVGRLWNAARNAPLGPETLFVLVSDHGMNTTPEIMSQGFSLVKWFNGVEGGAQHVITDRYPLEGYKLRGLDPFVHKVLTPSSASWYLKSDPQHYPTVVLDLDGNERAAIQLRSNEWNIAQVLLDAANDPRTSAAVKAACRNELDRWAEIERTRWAPEAAELEAQVAAWEHSAREADTNIATAKASKSDDSERVAALRRIAARAAEQRQEAAAYRGYLEAVKRFLAMPHDAGPGLTPRESLGPENSVYDLQNYVVGPAPGGIVLDAAGRIDGERSFRRVDYMAKLQAIQVRNQVQPGITNRPVDFSAVPLPAASLPTETAGADPVDGAIWLFGGAERQALVLYRQRGGQFEIRYAPVTDVRGAPDGSVGFEECPLGPTLPLELFEDPDLRLPAGAIRQEWLTAWHTDGEWLDALFQTRYTNGLIGLTELFRAPEPGVPAWAASLAEPDRARVMELIRKRRLLTRPDIEVFASDHWNFNARNFNSGGNHGSFLRASTHSVLMFSGGDQTGIPKGLSVTEPYDSLALVPTVLELMKRSSPAPPPAGQPIRELTGAPPTAPPIMSP